MKDAFKKLRFSACCAGLILGLGGYADAQTTQQPVEIANAATLQAISAEVVKLIAKEKYFEACFMLDRYYPADTQDIQALFLRARCNKGQKKFAESIKAYEALALLAPDSARVQQELAEARTLGEKHRLEEKNNPTKPKNWFARLETGVVFDTNINTGPASDEIEILSTPISLGIETVEAPGYTVSALAGIVHVQSPRLVWVAKTSVDYSDYDTDEDYAFFSMNVSGGPTVQFGKAKISIQPGYTWQNYGGSTYNNIADLTTRLTYKTSERLTLNTRVSVSSNDYEASETRDSTVLSLSQGGDFMFDDSLTLSPSVFGRFESAASKTDSNKMIGYRMNVEKKLDSNFKIFGGFQQSSRGYSEADTTLSTAQRYDTQRATSLGGSFNVGGTKFPQAFLNLRYQKIENDSNVSVYSHKRDEINLTFSKLW
jgi:hypothetical protein